MRHVLFLILSVAIHFAALKIYFVQKGDFPHAECVSIEICMEEPQSLPSNSVQESAVRDSVASPSDDAEPEVQSVHSVEKSDPEEKATFSAYVPVVIPPKLSATPKPIYPVSERRAGHEGSVLVLVCVDEDGSTASASVKKSSGYRALDKSALSAVKRCKFTPGMCDGRACKGDFVVEVVFKLK